MNNKVSILSTIALDQRLIDKAAGQGVILDGVPFIQVAAIDNADIKGEVADLCTRTIAAVFTSANAVKAISETTKELQPAWSIYCIGHATRLAVLECFPAEAIKGMANDAAGLAEIIKTEYMPEVVFFCGDKRMDTLPDILRSEDVHVHELVVYHTMEYDAILFFSPSSVHSFFIVNNVAADVVLFAIGTTTASALQKHTNNKMIISSTPSKEEMIADAINYFHKQAPLNTVQNNQTV
jgi:uroporphyrinogen-III synthase